MNKFGAVRTEFGGRIFASKKEARRCEELTWLRLAGEIHDLQMQPVYRLHVINTGSGEVIEIGKYIADFEYVLSDGTRVVEDVKSPITRKLSLYRWKIRHLKIEYGLDVTEV